MQRAGAHVQKKNTQNNNMPYIQSLQHSVAQPIP